METARRRLSKIIPQKSGETEFISGSKIAPVQYGYRIGIICMIILSLSIPAAGYFGIQAAVHESVKFTDIVYYQVISITQIKSQNLSISLHLL